MLFRFISSLKTIYILLLFTISRTYLYADILPTYSFQADTILTTTTNAQQKAILPDTFLIPENLRKETINFRVNSDLIYLSFSHFVNSSSKELFFKAWTKEKEVAKLYSFADSLRKLYTDSSNDLKEKITASIISTEKQIITLNEEIPILYEKARQIEHQYWQTTSHEELLKHQEIIQLFRDSLQQVIDNRNKQKVPETITYYMPERKNTAKAEPASEIIYKIQVGAFKGKLPDAASKSIKKLSVLRKVENYKDEKGVVVYTTGNLKKYQEALTMQNQVKHEGIKNATIAAYNNGKRISLEEAKKLTNDLVNP